MWPRVIGLTFIVALGFMIFQALLPISSFDLGYHLATGRYILHHLQIPQHDPFAIFSPTGIWPLHQGISAVVIYFAYALFNFWGLKVFLMGMVVASAWVLYFSEKQNLEIKKEWIALFAITALLLVVDRWELRPDLFSAFFLCLTAVIFRRYECRSSRKNLLSMFALFFVWPSVHAGFSFGLLFLVLWGLGYCFGERRFPFSILFSGFLGALLGLLVLGVYNPGGLYGLMEPLFFSNDTWFQKHIAEYRALEVVSNRMYVWSLLLTGGFSLPFVCRWRQNLKWILPAFVFILFSLFIIRMKIYVIPFVFWLWVSISKNKTLREYFFPIFFVNVWLFLSLGFFDLPYRNMFHTFDRLENPEKAIYFLEKNHMAGNIFNEDAWGGWVSFFFYPGAKVFVDNRLAVYGTEFYRSWYLETLKGGYNPLVQMDLWKIDHVLVRPNFTPAGLQDLLMKSAKWRLDYFDDVALVFSRNQGSENDVNRGRQMVLAQLGLADLAVLPTLDYFLNLSPSVIGHELKSVALARNGKIQEAMGEIDQLLAIDPCNLSSLLRKAIFFREQGKIGESAKVLAKGLECGGPQVEFLSTLAKLQIDEGYVLKPRRVLRVMRKFWPRSPEVGRLEKGSLI